MPDDKTLTVLIPGALAIIVIIGVVVLDVLGRPIDPVLIALAGIFGTWATGGIINASKNGGPPTTKGPS